MRDLLTKLALPAALVTAVFLLLPSQSAAQVPIPLISESPTPSPSPSKSPSKSPSSTPRPKPSSKRGSGGTSGSSGRTTKPAPSSKPTPRVLDPQVQEGVAAWLAREKSPARTTTRLLQLLADVNADGSVLSVGDLSKGFGRFPILGYVWYQDDWGAPRYIPYYHPHSGTDLFAATGTPVAATTDGVIMKIADGPVSGNAVWLRAKGSRAYFFYGHLHGFAPGLKVGQRVRRGDVIGYVGATGTAVGTPPHVHFEIHPTGSPDHAVNPKRYLDSWLRAAESRALGLLGYAPSGAPKLGAARWTSFLGSVSAPQSSPTLWSAVLVGSPVYASIDSSLARLLAEHDFTALMAEGSTGATVTMPSYDPMNPLAALFDARASHDH